jgi:hypothetical protein
MDGHAFISEMREFLQSVDWGKLMGESLGLGSLPSLAEVKVKAE